MNAVRRIVLTTLAAAAVVGGIIVVGLAVRGNLRDRYSLGVQQIECPAPPDKTREAFLNEVHYYGQLPERLNTLDPDFTDRLSAAFAKHPQVKSVERVTVSDRNRVRVDLMMREDRNDPPQ